MFINEGDCVGIVCFQMGSLEALTATRARSDSDDVWRWAEDELESLWSQEKLIRASLPERNRSALFSRVSLVYLRYIVVGRRLHACYQNIVHVQKRKDISRVLRAVCGRIVELKVTFRTCSRFKLLLQTYTLSTYDTLAWLGIGNTINNAIDEIIMMKHNLSSW